MTPMLLPLIAPPKLSKVEALAAYFKARPGQWISALDLAKVGGLLSSRTRISELRYPPYLMDVRNRTRAVNGDTHSEYRYEGPR
jgi:hypothetical protein